MNIEFSEREIDWLNNYAGNHDLSIEATMRMALRMFSLVEGTPGAREWLAKRTSELLGQKYDHMPPLEAERQRAGRLPSDTYSEEAVRVRLAGSTAERQPIPVTEIVAALEREAGNTDTDPRWLAAVELRRMVGWETRTLMCEQNAAESECVRAPSISPLAECRDCEMTLADHTSRPDETCGNFTLFIPQVSKQMPDPYAVFCEKHDIHAARYTNGRPLMNDICPLCELAVAFKIIRDIDRATGGLNHHVRRIGVMLPPSDTANAYSED